MRQGNVREIKKNQGQGIVREFYDLSVKNEFCQNIREMSGNFTFQSCKNLDVWSWCTILALFMNFSAPILSGKFEFMSGGGGGVREMSGNFILSYVWEPCRTFTVHHSDTLLHGKPTQLKYKDIWAATWQNQQNECLPSEDSDQTGHPPSLIRVFTVRMFCHESLLGAQPHCWFCHVTAHLQQ